MKTVNAMGDACPIPVVKTRNAIKELGPEGGVTETLVDNEVAVQNLTKMANQMGCTSVSEKLGEKQYKVTITVGAAKAAAEQETASPEPACMPDCRAKKTVVAITGDTMGSGDDTLGSVLIKGFLYALSQQDTLPDTILFYNGGAKLTCEGSPSLEDLKSMEAMGVEIMTCGTCLNHYGLKEKLQVGIVSNMYEIVEKMTLADKIIRP